MWFDDRAKPFVAAGILLVCAYLSIEARVALAQSPATSPAASAPPQPVAPAQPLAPGDVIVTGFSGLKLATEGILPGVDPVEKTVIDTEAASLRVFDLQSIGGPPAGQVATPAVKLEVKAKDVGQIFGLALDETNPSGTPSLFTAATSLFGLQIVAGSPDKDGSPVRLKAGAPGARFMTGQWGALAGAGPGTIYKIDITTGTPSVFATTDANGLANSGAGIAGPAIDGKSRSLYAADLDTGLIHRFALDTGGASTATFDHGDKGRTAAGRAAAADDGTRLDVASPAFKPDDPATWGLSPAERRVTALAVRDGRLYYAVAEGPEIWSIGLGADGAFGSDPRLETAVKTAKPATVTALAFDTEGRLVAALRGAQKSPFNFSKFVDPDSGRVLRFAPKSTDPAATERWTAEPEEFSIGGADGNVAASGGIGLGHGFGPEGTVDLAQCNATLIASGDTLADVASDDRVAHGIQLNASTLAKPANTPPSQSAFVDFDGRLGNVNERGHVGAVLAMQDCSGANAPPVEGPPVAEGGPPVEGGGGPPVAGGGGGPPVEDALGEEPPVEGPPVEEAVVDPNAPNLAVSKTQQCTVEPAGNPTKGTCAYTITITNTSQTPFVMDDGGVLLDRFNGATPQIAPVKGGAMGPDGFLVPTGPATSIPAGKATPGEPFSMSFDIPPGGTTVENCASVTLPPPRDIPVPESLADKAKARAEFSPKIGEITKTADGASDQGCKPIDKDTKLCQWRVNIDNRSFSEFKGTKLAITLSEPPIGSIGTFRSFENPPFPFPNTTADNKTFDVTADVEDTGQQVGVTGIFDANKPDPELTASVKEFGTPTVPLDVELKAGLQQASVDSNPADNTSCIAFNTNTPDDQGTPTNEPTQGEPLPDPNQGPPVVDDVPPGQAAPNLEVTKTKQCSVENARAKCTFDIAVKNTGTEIFQSAGIPLTDEFSGATPENLAAIQGQFPKATPTANGFVIPDDSPLTVLMPDQTIKVPSFTAEFPVPPGGLKFENCASIAPRPAGETLPPAPAPTQIADLADGPPTTEKKPGLSKTVAVTGADACQKRGDSLDCSFNVTVTNNGSEPFPLELAFVTTPPLTNLSTIPELKPGQGRANLAGGPEVAPGTSKTFTVQAVVPATTTGPVTAGATVFDPAGNSIDTESAKAGTAPALDAIPGVSTADDIPGDNRACVPFDSNNPADVTSNKPNLAIAKTAKPGQECKKGADSWTCEWDVEITNSGAPFTGKIGLTDVQNFASTVNALKQADEPSNISCASGAAALQNKCDVVATDLKAGGKPIKFQLLTKIPILSVPEATEKINCKAVNQLFLDAPPQGGGPIFAEATSPLEVPQTNNGTITHCDPPSLALTKTEQGCTASGSGFDCKFKLTVQSLGPDPFAGGIIEIDESAPEGTTLEAQSAGWSGCSGSGTVRCVSEKVVLAVGATKDLDVVVRVPKERVKPGQCEIKNEARIIMKRFLDPPPGSSLRATATAKIDSPECQPKKCVGEGQVMNDDGYCRCPAGEYFNPDMARCVGLPKDVCEVGFEGEYPNCCKPPGERYDAASQSCLIAEVKCFGGMTFVSSKGKCDCPADKPYDERRGKCAELARTCEAGWSGEYPDCCSPSEYSSKGTCYARQAVKEPLTGGTNDTVQPSLPETTKNRGTKVDDGPKYKYCNGKRVRASQPCPAGPKGGTNPTVDVKVDKDCYGKRIPIWKKCKAPKQPQNAGGSGGGGSGGCPANKPVGKPPYCCPAGTYFTGGACRSPTKNLTGGTNSTLSGAPPKKGPRRIGKRIPKTPAVVPDKRINYGSSSNDGKPAFVPPE